MTFIGDPNGQQQFYVMDEAEGNVGASGVGEVFQGPGYYDVGFGFSFQEGKVNFQGMKLVKALE